MRNLLLPSLFLILAMVGCQRAEINPSDTFSSNGLSIEVVEKGETGNPLILFVLDGEYLMEYFVNAYDDSGLNKKIIAVGINGNNRTNDFTISNVDGSGGGASNFLNTITQQIHEELMQRNTYDSTATKAIVGHSLSGLFAGHSMLNDNDFFDGYILLSPSFYWGNFEFFNQESTVRPTLLNKSGKIFIGAGDGEDLGMNNGVEQFIKY